MTHEEKMIYTVRPLASDTQSLHQDWVPASSIEPLAPQGVLHCVGQEVRIVQQSEVIVSYAHQDLLPVEQEDLRKIATATRLTPETTQEPVHWHLLPAAQIRLVRREEQLQDTVRGLTWNVDNFMADCQTACVITLNSLIIVPLIRVRFARVSQRNSDGQELHRMQKPQRPYMDVFAAREHWSDNPEKGRERSMYNW